MTTATVVAAWEAAGQAHLAVRVAEASGAVEYIGSVPLTDLAGMTTAQKKTTLVAAAKAVRDAQVAVNSALSITGTVTV